MMAKEKRYKKIKVYSEKLGKPIEVDLHPENLPKELYECVGISNADYGS